MSLWYNLWESCWRSELEPERDARVVRFDLSGRSASDIYLSHPNQLS